MSTTNQDSKSKLASKLKTATVSDNEIINEILAVSNKAASIEEQLEPSSEGVEGVSSIVKEVHPLISYHKRGRSINQLAGMFLITEAEVKRIIDENV